jgi:hypothetical protein
VLFASRSSQTGSSEDAPNAGLIARGLPCCRILLVGHDPHVRWLVTSAAQELRAEVRSFDAVDLLTSKIRHSNYDLVVICGAAATSHGHVALSAVRGAERPVPCLVVSFVHPCLAQVTVSDVAGRPTSTKVIDCENLARLPSRLIAGEDPWHNVD